MIDVAVILLAIRFVAVEARFEHVSRRGNVLVFRPVLIARAFIPAALFLLYRGFQVAKTGDWLVAGLGFGMAVFIFLNSLGTILVDKTRIRETRWLGLRRTQISWDDVVYAGGDVENRVTIRSKDDHAISHSAYHVDRDAFVEALKKYCLQCSYNQKAEGPQPGPSVPLGSP